MTKKGNDRDIARIALTIAIICFGIGLVTAVPQQDYTLYGTATLNGKALTAQDDDVIALKVDGVELVSYTMGDIAGTDNYVLKVPMDSDLSVTTAAQEGDSAYIYINGVAINEGVQVIGTPATVVTLDISATSASNPPAVTVVYPNGGESIPIGTQVQVSACATDDSAVTDVTFYHSNGSNWNSIGAGTRVSGTNKDGTWDITWDTVGLDASTNYKIKAVASDDTSTSEDQSDSAFSVTPSSIIWQGDVTLINGTTFTAMAHNSGESYEINRITALGALDAASEKGDFNYAISDEWYASLGCFVVDTIANIECTGAEWWLYWVNYPNESIPVVGVNLYEMKEGDVVTYYYGDMNVIPANASKVIKIHVHVQIGSPAIFDTGAPMNPYPSIPGTHTGTITPNQDTTVQKLYTHLCTGTGGHTDFARIYGDGLDGSASWIGYGECGHILTFDSSFTLEAGKIYNYEIMTGSYPQIHHTTALQTENGWINCTKFTDANGKEYDDWIPAIRLFG